MSASSIVIDGEMGVGDGNSSLVIVLLLDRLGLLDGVIDESRRSTPPMITVVVVVAIAPTVVEAGGVFSLAMRVGTSTGVHPSSLGLTLIDADGDGASSR